MELIGGTVVPSPARCILVVAIVIIDRYGIPLCKRWKVCRVGSHASINVRRCLDLDLLILVRELEAYTAHVSTPCCLIVGYFDFVAE